MKKKDITSKTCRPNHVWISETFGPDNVHVRSVLSRIKQNVVIGRNIDFDVYKKYLALQAYIYYSGARYEAWIVSILENSVL